MNIFQPASVLLPKAADMKLWSVIACDQFTSEPAYWERVRQTVGDAPSTLHMILPEAELDGSRREAAKTIHAAMARYLEQDVFSVYDRSYVYVERTLADGSLRPGLVGMVDLQSYDYRPGSVSAIRATERTVLERIPPRQEVRWNAPLEFPHVLMLCDDDQRCLIEPVGAKKNNFQKLYDFDLMESGGHITGWLVDAGTAADFDACFASYSRNCEKKYADLPDAKVILAVGDGNHSLAAAKSCFERWQAENPDADTRHCPLRYALVELENIHDPSIQFEPIHRLVTDVDCGRLLAVLKSACESGGFPVRYRMAGKTGELYLSRKLGELATQALQSLLDAYLEEHPGKIDYIHGSEELAALTQRENAVGFFLPPMEKSLLFRGVISGGVLPRKTFSMGHAREKRYYLEGRKLR